VTGSGRSGPDAFELPQFVATKTPRCGAANNWLRNSMTFPADSLHSAVIHSKLDANIPRFSEQQLSPWNA